MWPHHLAPAEKRVLDAVRRQPGMPRAALTALTGLAQQNVHRSVEALTEAGFLRLGEAEASGRGKPSPTVHLIPSALHTIGISLNSDAVVVALTDLSCKAVDSLVITDGADKRVSTLKAIDQAINTLLQRQDLPRRRIVGLGFGISGFKSGEPGCFVTPVPLNDWSGHNLKNEIETAFGFEAWVENNATTGAIGEAMVGAGLAHRTFAYLSFNYGFGGGIVIDGRAHDGGFGNAAELSRIYMEDQIESRPALGELVKRLQAHGVTVNRVSELAALYDPAWPGLEDWLDEITPQLDLIIRALAAIVDPTAIVFGGEAPSDLRSRMIQRCSINKLDRFGEPMPTPCLVNSTLNNDPAAFGASVIPLQLRVFGPINANRL